MAIEAGHEYWRAYALTQEAAYGTAATPDHSPATYESTDRMQYAPDSPVTDGDHISGREAATRLRKPRWKTMGNHPQWLTANEFPLFAILALGHVSRVIDEPALSWNTYTITSIAKTFTRAAAIEDAATVSVDDTDGFPSAGKVFLPSDGVTFTYTGKTGDATPTLTGCSAHRAIADDEAITLDPAMDTAHVPSTSMIEHGPNDQWLYPGIVCPSLEINVSRGELATMRAALMGDGTRASDTDNRPALVADEILEGGMCTVFLGGTWDGRTLTSPTAITTEVANLTLRITNNMEGNTGYGMGGGVKRTRAVRTGREIAVSAGLEINGDLATTYAQYFENNTVMALQYVLTGSSNYKATITIPRVQFRAEPRGGGIDIQVGSVDLAVLGHAYQTPIQIDVQNQIANYAYKWAA